MGRPNPTDNSTQIHNDHVAMITDHAQRRSNNCPHRCGIALVAVLVLFAVSLTLFGLWAKSAVLERQHMGSQLFRVQAQMLAEAGVYRALALRAADPKYDGETWPVPAESLGGARGAEVRIRISPTHDAAALRIDATAIYPLQRVRPAEATRRIEIPNPMTGDRS
jgi:hypothetical protein